MRTAAAAVIAVLVLAGCSSDGGDGTSLPTSDCQLEPVLCDPGHYLANHHCIREDVRPRIYAPDTPGPDLAPDPWAQGDWWTYSLDTGAGPKPSTLVYYDDADFAGDIPQHYMVGVPAREDALEHALFSVNPMIGRIHRALYSPHEAGLHADMFNFPLCEGATWTTTFYARSFALQAHHEEVQLPDGRTDAQGFVITGTSADGSTSRHTYSPLVKWFTSLRVERNDGLSVTMELTAYGHGRQGRVEFLRAQQDEVVQVSAIPADGWSVDRRAGPEGPFDRLALHLQAARTAGSGRIEVHLRDPAGTSVACVGVAGSGPLEQTQCPPGPVRLELPWKEGVWKVTVDRLVIDTATRAEGEVRVVSVYDRGGTV